MGIEERLDRNQSFQPKIPTCLQTPPVVLASVGYLENLPHSTQPHGHQCTYASSPDNELRATDRMAKPPLAVAVIPQLACEVHGMFRNKSVDYNHMKDIPLWGVKRAERVLSQYPPAFEKFPGVARRIGDIS